MSISWCNYSFNIFSILNLLRHMSFILRLITLCLWARILHNIMPTKNHQINSITREQERTSFDVSKTIYLATKKGVGLNWNISISRKNIFDLVIAISTIKVSSDAVLDTNSCKWIFQVKGLFPRILWRK